MMAGIISAPEAMMAAVVMAVAVAVSIYYY